MENSHASPGLLKQANSSTLHRVLREKGAATRAQLAAAAGVSVTTVRALLEEMLRDGEVECTGLSASSGGRERRNTVCAGRNTMVRPCVSQTGRLTACWWMCTERLSGPFL